MALSLEGTSRLGAEAGAWSQVGVPSKREAGGAVGQAQGSEEREGERGAGWAAARAGARRGEQAAAGAPSLEGKACVWRPR